MLSLDMSRALDEVPRQFLAKAMTHAGVSSELQHAILSIHEHCKYEVRHESHTGTFGMLRGVRQGCSLAPLLFAIYSCWLYDEMAKRTSQAWADQLVTLFVIFL